MFFNNSYLVYQSGFQVCLSPAPPSAQPVYKLSLREIRKSHTILCELQVFRFIPVGGVSIACDAIKCLYYITVQQNIQLLNKLKI